MRSTPCRPPPATAGPASRWHLFLLVLASLLLWPARAAAHTNEPPSFIVVLLDDAGWQDFNAATMPNTAAFAPYGRVYTRFYSAAVCSPSRYQMLYGRHGHRAYIGWALGVTGALQSGVRSREVSMVELLGVVGYQTALFGKWHLTGAHNGVPEEAARVHGFQTWRAGRPYNIVAPESHLGWTRVDDGVQSFSTTFTTEAIHTAFRNWWTSTSGPRLAVVSHLAPHEPYDAPPAHLLPPGHVVGNTIRARYAASLRVLDQTLADIATFVDPSNTYVVFVPDNGCPREVAPSVIHPGYKGTVYEGGIHVPLVVWGPGVQPGFDDSLLQMVDLPSTLLDLAGVVPAVGFEDSLPFTATFTGGNSTRDHVFVHSFAPQTGVAPTLTFEHWAVRRADGWKLIQQASTYALFDLVADPLEQSPISPASQPTVTAELEAVRLATLGSSWQY